MRHKYSGDFWTNLQPTDIFDGLPVYNSKDVDKIHNPFEYIYYFRYIINVWLIGVPWIIFSLGTIGWNWYVNIDWNGWWSKGNPWLIANSVALIIFNVHSWFLAFELPIYL